MIEIKNAQLSWRKRVDSIIFDPEEPYAIFKLVPLFPHCSGTLFEDDIILFLPDLAYSVEKPGAYEILTCTCGHAPCAGINEPVLVSHPDDATVVWELDIRGLGPALDDGLKDEDYLRLLDGHCGPPLRP